jgi:hypothetical protein
LKWSAADEGGASYLRTARERHKPLDWWRGERPVIKRQIVNGEVGPAFITAEWLTIPEEKATPLAAKRKGVARRARSGTVEPAPKKARRKQTSHGSDEDDQEPEADDVTGWDEGTEPGGMVMDFTTGQEVMRRKHPLPSHPLCVLTGRCSQRCCQHLCNGSTEGNTKRIFHLSEDIRRGRILCSRHSTHRSWWLQSSEEFQRQRIRKTIISQPTLASVSNPQK